MQYLADTNVDVLECHSRSLDLNPIDNAWALLVRKVYSHGRQFEYDDDLIETIHVAWDDIDQNLIITLLRSMPKRCIEVVAKRGGPTHC